MTTVKYFGYGANRDAKMIAAITGKAETELKGQPAILEDFALGIQNLDQLPDTVPSFSILPDSPRILIQKSWPKTFRSYVIFPEIGGHVIGTIWELSHDDRERVRDWELVGKYGGWYQDASGVAVTKDGQKVDIITEALGSGQSYGHKVNGLDYETWLNPIDQFMAIAPKARHEYDERLSSQRAFH